MSCTVEFLHKPNTEKRSKFIVYGIAVFLVFWYLMWIWFGCWFKSTYSNYYECTFNDVLDLAKGFNSQATKKNTSPNVICLQ